MAINAHIKIGSLKGESMIKGFEDQIQVLSWNWSMNQTGNVHAGGGAGAGKVNVGDLTFVHYVDAATPGLMLACCNGEHFAEATLSLQKAGKDPLQYITIKLEHVIITHVGTGGSEGQDLVTETVSLNFAKFSYTYQPQDETGAKKGGAIEAVFDIKANA